MKINDYYQSTNNDASPFCWPVTNKVSLIRVSLLEGLEVLQVEVRREGGM
jgi:hypothetical protein